MWPPPQKKLIQRLALSAVCWVAFCSAVSSGRHLHQTPLWPRNASFQADLQFAWGAGGSGPGQFRHPQGIAINQAGNVYVVDNGNHRVQAFTPVGEFLTQWGSGAGTGDGQFSGPCGIALNETGHVYVADTMNNRVQVFSSGGQFLFKWGAAGAGDGQFNHPTGIAINATAHVYITDTGNNRVQVFTPSGAYLRQWGSTGSGTGKFNWPTGIAINGTGCVFISDHKNDRVQVFAQDGQFMSAWGTRGAGDGQFNGTDGIAVNASGSICVVDQWNHRVQVFTSQGQYVGQWGAKGTGKGQFDAPSWIAANATGCIYVTDYYNNRVQAFLVSGEETPSNADPDPTYTNDWAYLIGALALIASCVMYGIVRGNKGNNSTKRTLKYTEHGGPSVASQPMGDEAATQKKYLEDWRAWTAEQERRKQEQLQAEERERVEQLRVAESERVERAEKLKQILKVSRRIRLSMVRNLLQMEPHEFNEAILQWAAEYGFTIDGDYLDVGDRGGVQSFIAQLDKSFKQWQQGAKTTKG